MARNSSKVADRGVSGSQPVGCRWTGKGATLEPLTVGSVAHRRWSPVKKLLGLIQPYLDSGESGYKVFRLIIKSMYFIVFFL